MWFQLNKCLVLGNHLLKLLSFGVQIVRHGGNTFLDLKTSKYGMRLQAQQFMLKKSG